MRDSFVRQIKNEIRIIKKIERGSEVCKIVPYIWKTGQELLPIPILKVNLERRERVEDQN